MESRDLSERDATNFIDNILNPYSEAYRVIKNSEYSSTSGADRVASYALTTQVLTYQEWTPDIVKARQAELIAVYKKNWEL